MFLDLLSLKLSWNRIATELWAQYQGVLLDCEGDINESDGDEEFDIMEI